MDYSISFPILMAFTEYIACRRLHFILLKLLVNLFHWVKNSHIARLCTVIGTFTSSQQMSTLSDQADWAKGVPCAFLFIESNCLHDCPMVPLQTFPQR